jgi:hypothetical protein
MAPQILLHLLLHPHYSWDLSMSEHDFFPKSWIGGRQTLTTLMLTAHPDNCQHTQLICFVSIASMTKRGHSIEVRRQSSSRSERIFPHHKILLTHTRSQHKSGIWGHAETSLLINSYLKMKKCLHLTCEWATMLDIFDWNDSELPLGTVGVSVPHCNH